MKRLFIPTMLIAFNALFAQKNIIPITESYEIRASDEEIIIDLNSALLDSAYKGDETLTFFLSSGAPVKLGLIDFCALSECSRIIETTGAPESEARVTAPTGPINLPKYPLILRIKGEHDYLDLLINVIDSDGKVIHRRTLKLTGKTPKVNSFKFIYDDGSESENELIFKENSNLRGSTILLDGENLNQKFERVTIANLNLVRDQSLDSEGLIAYKTDTSWTLKKLQNLNIENTQLSLKRFLAPKPYSRIISIKTLEPEVNNPEPIKLSPGTISFNLELSGSNIYKGAKIFATNIIGNNTLRISGELNGSTVNIDSKSISQRIELTKNALLGGNASFNVIVKNHDGRESAPLTIDIQVLQASISVTELGEKLPFVEGLTIGARFTRGVGGSTFNFVGPVKIKIGNNDHSIIQPRNITSSADQFIADIPFLLENAGFNVPFTISDNLNSWTGYFNEIKELPELKQFNPSIFPGTSLTIELEAKNDNANVSISAPEGIELTDESFSDSRIKISASLVTIANQTFEIDFLIFDHLWRTEKIAIKDWPDSEKDIKISSNNDTNPLDPTLTFTLNEKDIFHVRSTKVSDPRINSNITAQLIKADGTSLGQPQKLIKSSDSDLFETRFQPFRYGLKGGNEFKLELRNPSSPPFSQNFYLRRNFPQNIVVKAGLSAFNIFLKDRWAKGEMNPKPENKLPRTSIISGINLGLYFMPEIIKKEGNRPLGLGLNLHAQNQSNGGNPEVEFRYGPSILIYETLSMGITFKKNSPAAFFIGANVSFLDFAKLFSSGDQ